jgi:hypothetical protein
MRTSLKTAQTTFAKAAKAFVKASIGVRKAIGSLSSPYLMDYCVVRLAGPRRAGHSTLIASMSKDWKNPLFLYPNEAIASTMQELLGLNKARVKSIGNAGAVLRLRGVPADVVFVDGASAISQNTERELIAHCQAYAATNKNFLLILVQ